MSHNTRVIKRRIQSVENTQKITKAMELVAAAKMRRASLSAARGLPYARAVRFFASNLRLGAPQDAHSLLASRPLFRLAVVIFSGNKGLCGGFNRDVANFSLRVARAYKEQGVDVDFITFGKKGAHMIRLANARIVADFEKPDVVSSVKDVAPLASYLIHAFEQKVYDGIRVVFTRFISSLAQKPDSFSLLPFEEKARDDNSPTDDRLFEYTFEPSASVVLAYLLPRLVHVALYEAALESSASEHSARMVAMKNAGEAAKDMKEGFITVFNRARQASITQEIAEISAGQMN